MSVYFYQQDAVVFWLNHNGIRVVYIYGEYGKTIRRVPDDACSAMRQSRLTSGVGKTAMYACRIPIEQITDDAKGAYETFLSDAGVVFENENRDVILFWIRPVISTELDLAKSLRMLFDRCFLFDLGAEKPPVIHFNPRHPERETVLKAATLAGVIT